MSSDIHVSSDGATAFLYLVSDDVHNSTCSEHLTGGAATADISRLLAANTLNLFVNSISWLISVGSFDAGTFSTDMCRLFRGCGTGFLQAFAASQNLAVVFLYLRPQDCVLISTTSVPQQRKQLTVSSSKESSMDSQESGSSESPGQDGNSSSTDDTLSGGDADSKAQAVSASVFAPVRWTGIVYQVDKQKICVDVISVSDRSADSRPALGLHHLR